MRRSPRRGLTLDLLPAVIAGGIGITVGARFGERIAKHINREMMEKLVYIMVAVTGVKTIVEL